MKPRPEKITGQIVDVINDRIFKGEIYIENGEIKSIREVARAESQYILPGLIDAHVHIESSMLVPSEFARMAVTHGTIATVSDPHEIANVNGLEGVYYMLENARKTPFYVNFGAPSCVPATGFETSGAHLGPDEVEALLKRPDILYLSEMMNYPGVLFSEPEVIDKLKIAAKYGKPVDGHAPGLTGENARKYIKAGITTDHECFSKEEALYKINHGMKIIIREGSAAKNFDALIELIEKYPDSLMFCSDDKHPDALVESHIDDLVRRSISNGFRMIDILRVATLNPSLHYRLPHGLLREGDPADFIVVDDLKEFHVKETWLQGQKVAENGKSLLPYIESGVVNHFDCRYIHEEELKLTAESGRINVIEIQPDQLITKAMIADTRIRNGYAESDPEADILKIVVINRYSQESKPAIGFVKGFGLQRGALASTIAHDSHNIIAVGADDESIANAINLLVKNKGGISLVSENNQNILSLPVAGLMSTANGYNVADKYKEIDYQAKNLGSKLAAPYMSMSFLALLVIPELKMSDQGLFDGKEFRFTSLFV
ncbi:MAG: adenine deaminase [Bacteroidota bacterium]|nr:adenine deaminase [Bacteroidota bacterium]